MRVAPGIFDNATYSESRKLGHAKMVFDGRKGIAYLIHAFSMFEAFLSQSSGNVRGSFQRCFNLGWYGPSGIGNVQHNQYNTVRLTLSWRLLEPRVVQLCFGSAHRPVISFLSHGGIHRFGFLLGLLPLSRFMWPPHTQPPHQHLLEEP